MIIMRRVNRYHASLITIPINLKKKFMEKIVLVLDGSRLDMVTVDFACYIARLTHSRLTALFIENIKGEARPALKQLYSLPYVETITAGDLPENEERLSCCEKSEKSFC